MENRIDNGQRREGHDAETNDDRMSNDAIQTNKNIGRMHRAYGNDNYYGGNNNYNNNWRRNIHDTERTGLGQRQDRRTYRQTNNYRSRIRPEVIAMHCDNENITYAQAVKKAKESIDLKKIGIGNVNMRRARNGGLIIRVNGPSNKEKADILSKAMREVLEKDCI